MLKINKHYKFQLVKEIRQFMIINYPEFQLQSKEIKDSMNFVSGFLSCIRWLGEEPIREEELKEVLKKEIIDFLLKKESSEFIKERS